MCQISTRPLIACRRKFVTSKSIVSKPPITLQLLVASRISVQQRPVRSLLTLQFCTDSLLLLAHCCSLLFFVFFFQGTGAPKTPTARRRYYKDPAEEGVKDKLILEMRAEITRLRANVMTAHEKIRTLEQLHAHDEERILHLQEELGIKKGPEAVARAQAKAAASATAAAVAAAAAAEAEAAETEAAAIAEAAAAAAAADENDNKHEAEDDPEGEPSPKKQRVEEVDAENTIAV